MQICFYAIREGSNTILDEELGGASQFYTNILSDTLERCGYTNQARLRGLRSKQPTKVGFILIAPGLKPVGFLHIWDAPELEVAYSFYLRRINWLYSCIKLVLLLYYLCFDSTFCFSGFLPKDTV